MSVASHLQIRLDEYDARIRTFIPWYEEMLQWTATALRKLDQPSPRVIDLGAGTGALSAACARLIPDIHLTLVDADADILQIARSRLPLLATAPAFVDGNFVTVELPPADAIVSSLALHHVADARAKGEFFRKLRGVIIPGGFLVIADCCPSADSRLARAEHEVWREHLRQTYSDEETTRLFDSWAGEDTYFALPDELDRLRLAGFAPDVVWRKGPFAVIAAVNPRG